MSRESGCSVCDCGKYSDGRAVSKKIAICAAGGVAAICAAIAMVTVCMDVMMAFVFVMAAGALFSGAVKIHCSAKCCGAIK